MVYRPPSQLEKHYLKNTGHALYFALLLLADYVNLEEAETDFSDFLSNCDANIESKAKLLSRIP